ncbi:response regulator [Pedobacter sp. Leaf194]|uniref:response regulator n=1 Tax=Pedobacter sp. Leaf194 TaxID=1736297 RepID=UPI00070300D7|nr:response regulator [Pedobacter sp. Leaf194]KQS41215.1 histidine kinase [Pedobacter sp. Leaf194]
MASKKIIICDDDAGIVDVLELMLEDTGHIVIPELKSLNVKALIENKEPDLLILDLWMPVISGDQILKMIRSNPKTMNLPVIVMSASRDGAEIAAAAGANAYLAKPFDFDHVLAVVEECLN